MTIEFVTATPNLVIKDNGDSSCVQVDVPGYGRLGRSGLPALPVTGALLGVPPDAEIELKILDVAESVLNLALPVCPVPVPDIEQLASGEFGYRSEERVPPPDAHAASALYPPHRCRAQLHRMDPQPARGPGAVRPTAGQPGRR